MNFALPDLRGTRADPRWQRPHAWRERRRAGAHAVDQRTAGRTRMWPTPPRTRPARQALPSGSVPRRRSTTPTMYAGADWPCIQPASVTNVGGSQAHLNMQPFLTLSFCIALQGIFPSPELERTNDGTTICWRDPDVRRQLRAGRLDVLRRTAAADLRERDPVPADRHHLRRRRARSTFALPDLRGRIPIHQGNGFILAETGGAEEVTLTVQADRGAHAIRCSRRPAPATHPIPPEQCARQTDATIDAVHQPARRRAT